LKNRFLILFFLIVSVILSISSFAQTDTIKNKDEVIINGKRYKAVDEKQTSVSNKKNIPPLDSIFVIQNKKLKYYNNWLTAGAGVQKNLTYKRKTGFTGGLDFNFHIKQYYFQLGAELTGEQFGFYDNYEFHLGYGKRFEDRDIHYAGFVGLSYSTGYGKVDSVYTRPFSEPGIYGQIEIVKKVTYDVGIGAAVFADWNQEQGIIGVRLILYFSGAYKGKNNEQYMGK
jgi:hypothetical protein